MGGVGGWVGGFWGGCFGGRGVGVVVVGVRGEGGSWVWCSGFLRSGEGCVGLCIECLVISLGEEADDS